MTELAALIREEIAHGGPMPFSRYMELALYHAEYGYYRRARDPFGKRGDYYTAEQLQPVFGILMAARIGALLDEMGELEEATIVELGAGRGEMAEAFASWRYVPIEIGSAALPERVRGCIFSNEFFDALPVEVAVRRAETFREMRVGWNGERFVWVEGDRVDAETEAFLLRYTAARQDGDLVEVTREAVRWLERAAGSLERGFVITVDYGYTARESARFPRGTLMSYRRHQASEDVLSDPGERDITAHVCFSALEEHGRRCGLEPARFETLARTLLDAGEPDGFASALGSGGAMEQARRRLQLKTLLFGMGETFRTLIQRKG